MKVAASFVRGTSSTSAEAQRWRTGFPRSAASTSAARADAMSRSYRTLVASCARDTPSADHSERECGRERASTEGNETRVRDGALGARAPQGRTSVHELRDFLCEAALREARLGRFLHGASAKRAPDGQAMRQARRRTWCSCIKLSTSSRDKRVNILRYRPTSASDDLRKNCASGAGGQVSRCAPIATQGHPRLTW